MAIVICLTVVFLATFRTHVEHYKGEVVPATVAAFFAIVAWSFVLALLLGAMAALKVLS